MYLSGQGPIDPESSAIVGDTFAEQARSTLENIRGVVEGLAASLDRVVKVNAYLSDTADIMIEIDAVVLAG